MSRFTTTLIVLADLFVATFAVPGAFHVVEHAAKHAAATTCPKYILINTRGTLEKQGESSSFAPMNSDITSKLSGGHIYSTVYPASGNQNSTAGTDDMLSHIKSHLAADPDMCFVLQGFSQGAAATVDALQHLTTGAEFAAIKGVILLGDPRHMSGLACNIDSKGGNSTKYVHGIEPTKPAIPEVFISKTIDICAFADGVCDTRDGNGVDKQHLSYPTDANVQSMGYHFAVAHLSGAA